MANEKIVRTVIDNVIHTGRFLYMRTINGHTYVVADWKRSNDITRNVPVAQFAVLAADVTFVNQ